MSGIGSITHQEKRFGDCLGIKKISNEEKAEEVVYDVDDEDMRHLSVLLVLPNSKQRMITLEVPNALDELHILKAIKDQISETEDMQLDIYALNGDYYNFDYVVESQLLNNRSETKSNDSNDSVCIIDKDSSIESINSDESKSLLTMSDMMNFTPFTEDNSIGSERIKSISLDSSSSENEKIDINTNTNTNTNIDVRRGAKVQGGVERSLTMETSRYEETSIEETSEEKINLHVNTEIEESRRTTKTSTTECAYTSSSGLRNTETSTDEEKVINLDDSPVLGQRTSHQMHSKASNLDILIIYPSSPAKGGIAINTEDYKCLGRNEFLNDSVIDFYLKYLKHEVLSDHDRRRTHIFSSHFFTRLDKPYLLSSSLRENVSVTRQRYAGVQRWTKGINIFEKDFVIVPINERAHWYLAIICFANLIDSGSEPDYSTNNEEVTRPCLLIFDSLNHSPRKRVAKILRGYLYYEYISKFQKLKNFSKILLPTVYPIVPKQSNETDCGLFLLQYVETFFKNPIKNYSLPLKCLKDWFDPIIVRRKRKEIATLIGRLAKVFHKDEHFELPDIQFDSESTKKSHCTDENKYRLNTKTQLKAERNNNNNNDSQLKSLSAKSFYNSKINHSLSKESNEPAPMIQTNQSLFSNRENLSIECKKSKSPMRVAGTSTGTNTLIKSTAKCHKKYNVKECLRSKKIKKTDTSSSEWLCALSFEALKRDTKISPRTSYSEFLQAKKRFQEAEKRNYDSSD